MAAILKLRRGTSFTSLQESELFYNTSLETIQIGDGSGSNTSSKILVKLNESNSGSLHLLGDITGSNIYVSGDITASNLSLSGDADIVGNITLGGDIFLGDGTNATDNINVNASFSGSLIPTTTSVFSLGTNTKKYLDLRVVNATIDNINLPGSTILSSSVTDFTDYSQSVDNRLDLEEAKSVTLETVTSSLDTRLDVEEAKSTTLTALTASYDGRLSNLQITSASHDGRLDVEEAKSTTLETVTSSLDVRLDVEEAKSTILETVTSSLDNRISQLETDTGSQDGRLDNLELISASHDGRLDVEEAKSVTLETVTASLDTRLDVEEAKSVTLETVTASLDTRLDNVESYTSSFASDTVTLTNKTINGANNTLTVDISRDTNLAVSDTTEVNMILTDDTISAELIGGVVSGSSQIDYSALSGINANIISASSDTSQVDMIINGGSISANLKGGVVSGSTQIDYSGLSGINNDIVSASTDSGRVNFTIADGNITADLIGGVVTGSNQINIDHLDTSDLSEHSSNLYYTDVRVKTKLDTETVISGSSQVSLGGDVTGTADDVNVGSVQGVALTSGEATQISNIGSTTISSTQWGYLGASNQGIATIDDVTFNTGSFTGNVSVTGNLTVLGSATEILTSELRITDKLITVASGSVDSAAADGAGIEIDGADVSIQWDHNTTSFVLDAKVSSSVGFKGEGGELTGIDTEQVTEGSNLYYTDTRVKTKLNTENVHSGSFLGTSTTTNLSEGTNLYWTEARLSSSLDNRGVISGSSQINADSITNFDSNVKSKLDAETVVSGSSQVDADQTTGWIADVRTQIDNIGLVSSSIQINANSITNFDSNVKSKLDAETVVSGSTQINISHLDTDDLSEGSSNLYYTDTRVKAKLDVETVVSGSSQIDIHSTDGYVANEHIDHSSITIGSGKGLSGGGTIDTNRSLSLDSGSVHFSEGVKKRLDAETVISGSSQIDYNSIQNQPTTITSTQASNITTNNSKVGYLDSLVKTKLNTETVVSGSTFASNHQGSFTSSINGVATNVDLGLNTNDSPTFNTITLSSVAAGGSSDYDAIFDVSGLLKKRTIGTAAFLNVSASISDDPNSIPTTKAVNDALVAAGAGDITSVNSTTTISSTTTGLIHTEEGTEDGGAYGNTGNIVIAIATGSAHFLNGVSAAGAPLGTVSGSQQVIDHLPTGTVSGSSQLYSDLDSRYNNELGEGVVSGSAQVDYNSIQNQPTTITGGQASAITANTAKTGISSGQASAITANTAKTGITSGQASAITANTAKTGITSGQASAITTNTNKVGYTDALVKTKLDAETVISGSSQIDYDSIQNQPTTISVGQASAISTNTGKVGITSGQASAITTNTAKTGITSGQASAITTNTNKVGYTDALVKAKLTAEVVVSGSNSDVKTFLSISSSDISDVAAFSQSGNYSGLRAQSTTKADVGLGSVDNTTDAGKPVSTAQATAIGLKANIASPTFTGTVGGVTATMVGLGNVTNESKSTMFTSPTFTGTPLSTTPSSNDSSTKIATTAYVQGELTDLIGGAGAAFDTLLEISASIGNGDSDVVALTTTVGTKLAKSTNLSDLADAGTARTNLGVAIGTDVQAYNATLAAVAGSTYSGDDAIVTVGTIGTGTWQGTAINATYLDGQSGTNTGDEPDASVTVKGIVELATTVETTTGTDTSRAVTPDGLKDGYQGSANVDTLGTIGTGVWNGTVITSAYLDADTAHLSGTQTFGGTKSFDEAVTINKTTSSTTKATGALIVAGGVGIAGAVNVGGDIVAYSSSDRELKNNIQPISNPLEKINKIGGYSFDWNEDKQDIYKGTDIGVIAQEIEEVLPELVQTRENGYKAVKYDKLVSLLIEGIKELSNEVEELKRKIDNQ